MMKLMILGANGQVGSALIGHLKALGEVQALGRQEADLNEPDRLNEALHAWQPEVIVNAAAYTAVDRAEAEADLAWRINAEAPGFLARWAAQHRALLVHYSTDYVFDGRLERPYREADATGPLSQYGKSKLGGEEAVAQSGAEYLLLRTAWVYDHRGKNFLTTMLRLMQERERLDVVDDQRGTPTWADWIARTTAQLVEIAQNERRLGNVVRQTLHLTPTGDTTWFGFARQIAQLARENGLDLALTDLRPIPTSAYPTPAVRPSNSRLDTAALRAYLGQELPDWAALLRQCMSQH